jgi:hypothetical protein
LVLRFVLRWCSCTITIQTQLTSKILPTRIDLRTDAWLEPSLYISSMSVTSKSDQTSLLTRAGLAFRLLDLAGGFCIAVVVPVQDVNDVNLPRGVTRAHR